VEVPPAGGGGGGGVGGGGGPGGGGPPGGGGGGGAELAVVLQPVDRHHLHVVGSGPQRLPSSDAGTDSPDYAARQ
jgi:hypothetical protein